MDQRRNHEHTVEHRHAASLDDTFDFLNTSELDGFGRPVEHLAELHRRHGMARGARAAPSIEAQAARRGRTRPGPRSSWRHVRTVRSGLREIVEALVAERPVDAGRRWPPSTSSCAPGACWSSFPAKAASPSAIATWATRSTTRWPRSSSRWSR